MSRVISLASYTFLPVKTGGQKCIALFFKYFSKYVHLTSLTTEANENEQADGYQTIKIFSSSKFRYVNPLYYFRIKKIIKEIKATHLLLEHPYYGWLGILLKWGAPIKLIIQSHNIESLRFKTLNKWWWRILWYYERATHTNADYNYFITEEDRQYAIQNFGLIEQKCLVVTYGIERSARPAAEEILHAKEIIRSQYQISNEENLLLFTGSFNYQPNLMALEVIEKHIASILEQWKFPFKIIICGTGLEDRTSSHHKVIYAGFVPDIDSFFMAADVFLNPISEGGGIKTKLVEALGMNSNAVSTRLGAIGVNPTLCTGKLLIEDDEDWESFCKAIIKACDLHADISQDFYQHFYWGHSAKKAAAFINS